MSRNPLDSAEKPFDAAEEVNALLDLAGAPRLYDYQHLYRETEETAGTIMMENAELFNRLEGIGLKPEAERKEILLAIANLSRQERGQPIPFWHLSADDQAFLALYAQERNGQLFLMSYNINQGLKQDFETLTNKRGTYNVQEAYAAAEKRAQQLLKICVPQLNGLSRKPEIEQIKALEVIKALLARLSAKNVYLKRMRLAIPTELNTADQAFLKPFCNDENPPQLTSYTVSEGLRKLTR